MIDFTKQIILIGEPGYTGEMKKGIFTVLNYAARDKVCWPCTALPTWVRMAIRRLFGPSGTGKTTLSADLIANSSGDDEHGWTEDTVFNLKADATPSAWI